MLTRVHVFRTTRCQKIWINFENILLSFQSFYSFHCSALQPSSSKQSRLYMSLFEWSLLRQMYSSGLSGCFRFICDWKWQPNQFFVQTIQLHLKYRAENITLCTCFATEAKDLLIDCMLVYGAFVMMCNFFLSQLPFLVWNFSGRRHWLVHNELKSFKVYFFTSITI